MKNLKVYTFYSQFQVYLHTRSSDIVYLLFFIVAYSHSRNYSYKETVCILIMIEGLWDHLGRQMGIMLMNKCISWESVLQEIITLR